MKHARTRTDTRKDTQTHTHSHLHLRVLGDLGLLKDGCVTYPGLCYLHDCSIRYKGIVFFNVIEKLITFSLHYTTPCPWQREGESSFLFYDIVNRAEEMYEAN